MAQWYQESESTNETYGFVTIGEDMVFPLDPRRHSSWLKLRRTQSWINRFIQNCQKPKTDRTSGELLADELKRAEIQLVRLPEYRIPEGMDSFVSRSVLACTQQATRITTKIRRRWIAAFRWTFEERKIPLV